MSFRVTLALLMTAAFADSASAQNSPTAPASDPPAKNQLTKPDSKPANRSVMTAPQPAAQNPAAASTKPAVTAAPTHRTLSANPHDSKRDVPRIQPSELGRMAVDNKGATFGFSSETKMNMYATPDGQRIRGLDHAITSNRQPNYFGLSLSVPTTGTSSGDGAPGLFQIPPRN